MPHCTVRARRLTVCAAWACGMPGRLNYIRAPNERALASWPVTGVNPAAMSENFL